MSVVSLVIYVPFAVLSGWLYVDYNPKLKSAESKPHGRVELVFTLGRVAISFVNSFFGSTEGGKTIVLIVVLITATGSMAVVAAACIPFLMHIKLEEEMGAIGYLGFAFVLGILLSDVRYKQFCMLYNRYFAKLSPDLQNEGKPTEAYDNVFNSAMDLSAIKPMRFGNLLFETDYYLLIKKIIDDWDTYSRTERRDHIAVLREMYLSIAESMKVDSGMFLLTCAYLEYYLARDANTALTLLIRAKASRPPIDVRVALYGLAKDIESAREAEMRVGQTGLSITVFLDRYYDSATKNHNDIYVCARKLLKMSVMKATLQKDFAFVTVQLVSKAAKADKAYSQLLKDFPDAREAMALKARLYEEVFNDKAEAVRLLAAARDLEGVFKEQDATGSSYGESQSHSSSVSSRSERGDKGNYSSFTDEHYGRTEKMLHFVHVCLLLVVISIVFAKVQIGNTSQLIGLIPSSGDVLRSAVRLNVAWLKLIEDSCSYKSETLFELHRDELRQYIIDLAVGINTMRELGDSSIKKLFEDWSILLPSSNVTELYLQSPTNFATLTNTFISAMGDVADKYNYTTFPDAINSPQLQWAARHHGADLMYEWCLHLIEQQGLSSTLQLENTQRVNSWVNAANLVLIFLIMVFIIGVFHAKFKMYNTDASEHITSVILSRIGKRNRKRLLTQLAICRDIAAYGGQDERTSQDFLQDESGKLKVKEIAVFAEDVRNDDQFMRRKVSWSHHPDIKPNSFLISDSDDDLHSNKKAAVPTDNEGESGDSVPRKPPTLDTIEDADSRLSDDEDAEEESFNSVQEAHRPHSSNRPGLLKIRSKFSRKRDVEKKEMPSSRGPEVIKSAQVNEAVGDERSQEVFSGKPPDSDRNGESWSLFYLFNMAYQLVVTRPFTRFISICFLIELLLLALNMKVVSDATSNNAAFTNFLVLGPKVEFQALLTVYYAMYVVDDSNEPMNVLVE
ncbi:hypothetical protein HDU93_000309 [Gonapodya sp. JEL0774]|nr:hypothetical protein HDU93_000309 [Gonapodya sp. JEL0774]